MTNEQGDALRAQALQLIQQGDYARAIPVLEQALRFNPSDAALRSLLGISYANAGRHVQALDEFRQALRLEPNNVKNHFNLAMEFNTVGKKRDALESAEQALRIDPNHQGASNLVRQLRAELAPPPVPQAPPPTPEVYTGAIPPPVQPGQYAPYSQPQPANDYNYYPSNQSTSWYDSLAQSMGGFWITIPWIMFAISIGLFFYSMAIGLSSGLASGLSSSSDPSVLIDQIAKKTAGISQLSFLLLLITSIWTAIDIAYNRASWAWILTVLCCCCFPFPTIFYLLLGRNTGMRPGDKYI